jgi:hypothetical protein
MWMWVFVGGFIVGVLISWATTVMVARIPE